jgi:hypothetical protein
MAIIPNPRTWGATEQVTAAKLNADWRDSLNFLLTPPHCVLRKSAAQFFSSSVAANITWDIEDVDTDNGHNNAVNNTRYTAQTAGWYFYICTISWYPMQDGGMREIVLMKNGNNALRQGRSDDFPEMDTTFGSSRNFEVSCSTTQGFVNLAVADYIEIQAFQDSGVTLETGQGPPSGLNDDSCRWMIRWVRT